MQSTGQASAQECAFNKQGLPVFTKGFRFFPKFYFQLIPDSFIFSCDFKDKTAKCGTWLIFLKWSVYVYEVVLWKKPEAHSFTRKQ